MAIFVSYCPQFWVSGVIYKAYDTQYMFERHDQKLVIFACMAIFVSYCPQFWGFRGDLQGPWHRVHVWEAWPKTRRYCISDRFCELLSTVLGFWGDL
jgi:hypothetical protein